MPSTDTIRDLILDGYEMSIHCRAYPCSNRVKADLAAVERKHGLDWQWFGKRWPYRCYRCYRCGSRDVGMQLLPDVRPERRGRVGRFPVPALLGHARQVSTAQALPEAAGHGSARWGAPGANKSVRITEYL
jgi:hypothetical protein